MDKNEDNLIPEFMINDLFLKLKQLFFWMATIKNGYLFWIASTVNCITAYVNTTTRNMEKFMYFQQPQI